MRQETGEGVQNKTKKSSLPCFIFKWTRYMNIWMSLVASGEKNVGDEGKGGRERNKSGGGRIIKGKGSSPMEWTIKYIQRTYISIINVDPDIYAYEVYMYIFKIYRYLLQYMNAH